MKAAVLHVKIVLLEEHGSYISGFADALLFFLGLRIVQCILKECLVLYYLSCV